MYTYTKKTSLTSACEITIIYEYPRYFYNNRVVEVGIIDAAKMAYDIIA